MTSSMLTGERRWGAARRGGMTVLGKVAVPKPINLPSQRLENHGLDPTVEIVPKGTLSWGKGSSPASNAWGSSMISPSTDGGSGSPSRLSGRPSSGGSGTRPSTAGSDRASESTASAWGPSSRPSSASGPLTSNQSSVASLRPRSAETRPGSSQLSRFAEPLSENLVAWGAAGTAEKLGVASSKNDGFSLTSGDFPTLGSEKDNSGKNTEFQEHSSHARPGSSSGKVAPVKERTGASPVGDVSINDVKSGAVNTWKRDNSTYVEDGPRPSVENWRGEPQPYLNASIPPQHFEPWHGTPSPGGVWFRGPPGPPYGTPVAPGGFPMEPPFPYYRPQIPATALANSQPVPPPGAGPRGHHPKNGDMYRPHMPDAYIRPGMPIRPGFYPGPVPYEGYYPPPMGYCNSSERDIPFMGMAAGRPVYERYSNQNARDSNNSHARTGGYGSSGKSVVPEQAESGHPHDNRGPYKVLLKQHNDWEGKDEQKWDHTGTTNASDLEKGGQRKTSSWDDDWEADPKKIDELDSRRIKVGEEAASQNSDNPIGSSAPVKVKLTEGVSNMKAIDDSTTKKIETAASTFPEAPKPYPAAPKDSTLIQKIEGLNAKARASDGRHDASFVSSREEHKNSLQVDTTKTNQSTKEAGSGAAYSERIDTSAIPIPASHEVGVSTGLGSKDRSLEQIASGGTVISRRATHGGQGRVDHRSKGRFNTQDVDGWRKKSLVADSSSVTNGELSSNVHVQDCHSSMQAPQKSGLHLQGAEDGESGSMSDPSDTQAQRIKMKETAKQRAKQLQKEEEDRIREQKAKAHAKLEELNRRTQTVDGSTQKLENVQSSGAFQHKQEEMQMVAESNMDASKIGASSLTLVSSPSVTAQIHESHANRVGDSTDLSRELPIETPRSLYQEPIIPNNQSLPSQQNANSIDTVDNRKSPQMNDGSVSKQKRVGYKQRQNIPKQNIAVEKNLTEKSVSTVTIEKPKSHTDVVVIAAASDETVANEIATSGESNLPVNANITTESLGHQRRKNNRSGKNKLKLEEASLPRETNPGKASVENVEPKASELESDPSLIELISNSKDAVQSFENRGSLPNEEAHGRPTNQWKTQHPHPRRMPRNPQGNRSVEKLHNSDSVIWTPVRPQNKSEVADEVSQKTIVETVNTSSRGDHQVQNNLKNKRAEMERYVPKPVAKELAQQGSIQPPTSPSINPMTSDETIGKGESGSQSTDSAELAVTAIEKSGFAVESRNVDTKANRQAKSGSWRPRVPTESTRVQGWQEESSYTSNSGKNVQKSIEHSESLKPDGQSVKGQSKYSDDWNTPAGWNTLESSDSAAPVPSAVVKDQGVAGRGKRHPFKGQKGMGNTHGLDHKNVSSGNTDKMCIQSSPHEMGQTDTTVALKENHGAGERSLTQWQPKSQAYPVHNQRGGRYSSSQNVNAEVARTMRKESTPHGEAHFPPQHDKETNHPCTDQPASETGTVIEAPNAGHQETKRGEKNVASFKGRPHSPNQVPVYSVEPVPAVTDIRNEQRSSTGFRKNGNHSNRFSRVGHESRGDWSSGGQDNKQHNQPANRERQRHNSHYEYQPVGPFSNNRSNFEGASDGSHNTSLRFRERGQGHSRRGGGNFHGRQSGNVQVDASYD